MGEKVQLLPLLLPALIIAATLHELAHGLVARMLGDRTAQMAGRLTLNPIRHLDLYGSLTFLLTFLFTSFTFGWAKPVPVHPGHFRSPKRGMAFVALAGPVTNFLLAIGCYALLHFGIVDPESYVGKATQYAYYINIVLSLFNLFPVPPLDGSRIVGAFMSDQMYEQWAKLDEYAPIILLSLVILASDAIVPILDRGIEWSLQIMRLIFGA